MSWQIRIESPNGYACSVRLSINSPATGAIGDWESLTPNAFSSEVGQNQKGEVRMVGKESIVLEMLHGESVELDEFDANGPQRGPGTSNVTSGHLPIGDLVWETQG